LTQQDSGGHHCSKLEAGRVDIVASLRSGALRPRAFSKRLIVALRLNLKVLCEIIALKYTAGLASGFSCV